MSPSVVQHWLSLQCGILGRTAHASVYLGVPDQGPYLPVASWPVDEPVSDALGKVAQAALARREGIVAHIDRTDPDKDSPADAIASPLYINGQLHGAVVIELLDDSDPRQQAALQTLQLNTVWLEYLVSLDAGQADENRVSREHIALVGHALEAGSFDSNLIAVATRLANRFDCARVSIGFIEKNSAKVVALSHSARFETKQNLLRHIEKAMDEAIAQETVIAIPPIPGDAKPIDVMHSELARDFGSQSLLTVPVHYADKMTGALTFERGAGQDPFHKADIANIEGAVLLVGPILELRRRDGRSLAKKCSDHMGQLLKDFSTPGNLSLKAGAALLVVLVLFLSFAQGDYRVRAKAVLEGRIERVIVASQNGFIKSAHVRPGTLVRKHQILASLDDQDLKLEHLKWTSQRDQLAKEYRQALAEEDRVSIRVLSAKLDQAEAQIDLLERQLERIQVTAPFDGIIIAGDLSRSLGAPVEQGQILFKVAPLDSYRVKLHVDERDVGDVVAGLTGELVLASVPHEKFPFVVERLTPVAVSEDGENYFEVEARLQRHTDILRPGMGGVARIDIARRNLLWIWTHKTINAVRLALWSFGV